jgi:hypothetical protein
MQYQGMRAPSAPGKQAMNKTAVNGSPANDPRVAPVSEEDRVFERPDGFYWQAREDAREYGPFATLIEALEDRALAESPAGDEESLEVAETLEEAEAEVGISGWIDPDSGELGEEERPRVEEH